MPESESEEEELYVLYRSSYRLDAMPCLTLLLLAYVLAMDTVEIGVSGSTTPHIVYHMRVGRLTDSLTTRSETSPRVML
jgi:hypothetical protein